MAAHGNSLRAIIKHLKGISEEGKGQVWLDIVHLNIPTGVPCVFTLDEHLNWKSDEYLGDQDEIAAKIKGVAAQGKKQ